MPVFGVSFWTISGICVLLMYFAWWKIFEKAGRPGWAALIPIYNAYVQLQLVGKPGWWLILILIPGVNFVFSIWVLNLLSKRFGHGLGFTFGLIFLSFIFFLILALDDSRYTPPAPIN